MITLAGYGGLTDEELLALLKKGHEEAFDFLYYRYRNKLIAIAYNRLKSKEVAEELVQDVFTDIWQKRFSLQLRNKLSSYLCTAIKYTVLDHIRKQKTKDKYIAEMIKIVDNASPSIEEVLYVDELDYHLNKSIDTLPEKCREVFILSRFEDYSVREIAEKLNISPDTAKYHIAQALKKLRVNLKHIYNFFL
jgi:RNA polymerase sigma-70 factor (ECF subfamily)